MAAISDSAVTSGRGRASTSNIVFATDRTMSRRVAHNHTKAVRRLKVALPLIAIGTVAVFLATVLQTAGIGPSMPDIEIPQIVAENLKMKNPHYEGFQSDGGRYWVKAETAQQDLKTFSVVHLDGITGDLLDVKKQKTHLVAARGLFDNKANTLELYDSIKVTGDGGLNATLTHAKVKTKEGIITSDQPSTIIMGAGQIIYGPVSDMVGRRLPMYFGLTLFCIGSVGCALAPDVHSLIALRFVQGLGACACVVIPRAIVRDLYTGHEAARVMALLMLVFSVSPILAPLAGSLLVEFSGWRGFSKGHDYPFRTRAAA